jgi:hypothetical protein
LLLKFCFFSLHNLSCISMFLLSPSPSRCSYA